MAWPTDEVIDTTFPDNQTGDIGANDMRAFQKDITAAGKDYDAMTENVPTTFPPEAHNHPTSEVTGLDAALAGKAPSVHTHTSDEVSGQAVTVHDAAATYVKDDLVSYEGTIYFAIDDHGPAAFDLVNWSPIAGASGTGVTMSYKWTTTTSGQVPSGRFGITGLIGDASNTARVSGTTNKNVIVAPFWQNVAAGDYVLFVEDTGGAESVLFIVTGPAVEQVGSPDWYEIPVNLVTAVGESENNRAGLVSIVGNPNNRLPAGGTADQILVKQSVEDYDAEWKDGVTTDEVGGIKIEVVTSLPGTPVAGVLYLLVAP